MHNNYSVFYTWQLEFVEPFNRPRQSWENSTPVLFLGLNCNSQIYSAVSQRLIQITSTFYWDVISFRLSNHGPPWSSRRLFLNLTDFIFTLSAVQMIFPSWIIDSQDSICIYPCHLHLHWVLSLPEPLADRTFQQFFGGIFLNFLMYIT